MALNQTYEKFESFLVPEDSYIGRLYSTIDLGLQDTGFKKKDKDNNMTNEPLIQNKLKLTFELQDIKIPDGRPASVSRTYSASLNDKSNLKPILLALLGGNTEARDYLNTPGRKLSDVLEKVSGKTALVSVSHFTTKTGTTVAYMSNANTLPSSMQKLVQPQINPTTLHLDVDAIDPQDFANLPKSVQETINKRITSTSIAAVTSDSGTDDTVPF